MTLQFACEQVLTEDEVTCECVIPADNDLVEAVLDAAADLLVLISNAPVGRCETIYRPCRDAYCGFTACRCCRLFGIHLPGFEPTVDEVLIDGVEVDPSTYTVLITPNGQYVLERFDSDGRSVSWPYCQNLLLPSSAANTFEITVSTGLPIGPLTKLAVNEIACDMFAGLTGGDTSLPDGAVSASLNGLFVDWRRFGNPTDQATMTLAGLQWVQRYMATVSEGAHTQILAPELDDGWQLFQHAGQVVPA